MTHCFTRLICATALLLTIGPAQALTTQITYADGANEGFNDPVLGAARRTAFEFAVNLWASQMVGNIPVRIRAEFNPLGGSASAATLGQAGAVAYESDFAGAPQANTWYPIALANQFANTDLDPTDVDINAVFNSDVDNAIVLGDVDWYYGTDGNPPGSPTADRDLVTTVLHELGHGLGFADLIDPANGSFISTDPDIYSRQLRHSGLGDLANLSNGQRLAALTSDQLFWKGTNVVARMSGPVKMYAPNPYESGSSISHWDTSNTPDLLMEPLETGVHHDLDLTKEAFLDMGWIFVSGPAPAAAAPGRWELY